MSERYVIPSLQRAIQVLGLMADEQRSMTLAELTQRSGIPKSTLFRIMVTLQKHHCVTWSEEERSYRLGSYLWELGNRFADQSDLLRVSPNYMEALAEVSGETVFLSKIEDGEVVYLRRMESQKSVTVVKKLESRVPAHCTATGVAMLAFLPEKEVDAIIEEHGLEAFNEATVTSREALFERLAQVKEQQFAVVDGEYNRELLCVASPVFDYTHRPCAALTVAMLSAQLTDRSRIDRVGHMVRQAAQDLSREMGKIHHPVA